MMLGKKNDNPNMNFVLLNRRLVIGLTQEELAEEANCSKQIIAKLEKDKDYNVGIILARRICELLELTLDEAFGK